MDIKRKYVCLFISIIILLPVASTVVVCADDWPMFLHDQYNTGFTEIAGPSTNNLLWYNDTLASSLSISSPVIVNDKLFFKSHQNMLCLNASTGQKIWESDFGGGAAWSTPAVLDDKVYVGSGNGLFCLNIIDGTQAWNYTDMSIYGSSPVVVDGRVYVGTNNGIYCIDASTGVALWNFTNNSDYPEMQSAPSVINGKVYIQDQNWDVFCLDAVGNVDGTTDVIWTYSTSDETQPVGRHQSSPAVVDGRVYVGSVGKVFCLNAGTGAYIWNSSVAGAVYSSLAIANNRIFIGGGGSFYGLDAADGSEIWSYATGRTVMTSPAVADDKVYVCSDNMYCLDVANGDIIWDYASDYRFSSSPAVSNGRAYFIAMNGKMYCFEDETPAVEPQLTITMQSSVNEGESFQVTVTADGSPAEGVQLSFNSNIAQTNDEGVTSFIAPMVDKDTVFTITATKTGYQSANAQITINNVPVEEDQLVISVQTSVYEGDNFIITVIADGSPVESVIVAFAGDIVNTDINGQATLEAPEVDEDTPYSISASKEGFIQDAKSILVIDVPIEDDKTYSIYGIVYDNDGNILPSTEVCAAPSSDYIVASQCIHSDESGYYNIVLSSLGIYQVEARKDGYTIDSETITITTETYELDFILQKTEISRSTSITELAINQATEKGQVGAIINPEEGKLSIFGNIDVELESTDIDSDDGIKVVVSGNGTNGTKIVIYIGEVENPEEIIVQYDGLIISQAEDVIVFFNEGNTNTEWILTFADNKVIAIINIPSFSVHEITITMKEIIDTFIGLAFNIWYIAICIITAVIFITVVYIRRRL